MHWIDLLILGILAWFTLRAFSNGLIREMVGLAALIVGVLVAGRFYPELSTDTAFLIEDDSLRNFVAFGALFAGIIVVGYILASVLRRMASVLMLGPFDRLGGAAFGTLKGLILVQAALIAVAVFPPGTAVADAVASSSLAPYFLDEVPVVQFALPAEFDNAMQQLREWQQQGLAGAQQVQSGR